MEATLQDILDAREDRVRRQKRLLADYGKTLISFTMNIPGPVKNSPLINECFDTGCRWAAVQLERHMVYSDRSTRPSGCESLMVVDLPAERVKAITVELEEASELGRLFDFDVFAPDGTRLERSRERRCLLCGNSARVCGRSRAHSAEQLQTRTNEIMTRALEQERSRPIAAMAVKALLYEVCCTPKPGLVDRENSGSHRDMDIFTFLGSAAVLQPYFADCVVAGMRTAGESPEATFRRLRLLGVQAEDRMFRETRGINTHKGAIFTMGLLCGAVGRLSGTPRSEEQVLDTVAAMCRGLTSADLAGVTAENAKTTGERLYAESGITGVRGQAEAGFPAVLNTGLPVLREGVEMGLSMERAGCAALLALMTAATDTNLIARSDRDTARGITREVALLLARDRYPDESKLRILDELFTGKNLSPGGSADLLAASCFLYFLFPRSGE